MKRLMFVVIIAVGCWFGSLAQTNPVFNVSVLKSVNVGGVQTATNLVEVTMTFPSDIVWEVQVTTLVHGTNGVLWRPIVRTDYEWRTISANTVRYYIRPEREGKMFFRAKSKP